MIEPSPLPPVCIVTTRLSEPTQTFVRRHARELNGGNSVLVSRHAEDAAEYGGPFLPWPKPAMKPLPLRALSRVLGTSAVESPEGFPDEFAGFVHRHGVGLVLCEFGRIGVHFSALCKQAGVPMYCYFRGNDATRALRDFRYRRALKRMFAEADGIVAVSAFLLDSLKARGLVHANAHVVPSGVDVAEFMPAEKDPDLMLAVGRMIDKKAPLTTIRAFGMVAAEHPKARLEMIGDGPLLEPARRLVAQLGLERRVVLHGVRDHRFVAARMRQAAIFVQHSVTPANRDAEGAPTAIQEAMMCGAAVVSTRHAGIPELIEEGRTGLLVDERDLKGFARELGHLIGDGPRREQMGEAAHAHALEHFDYRKLYARLEAAMAATFAAR